MKKIYVLGDYQTSFTDFWIRNLEVAKEISYTLKRKKKNKKIISFLFLKFFWWWFIPPIFINLFLSSATKSTKEGKHLRNICRFSFILVSFKIATTFMDCVINLMYLCYLRLSIWFYLNEDFGELPNDPGLISHVKSLLVERQALYDTVWYANLHCSLKILLLILSVYILIGLIKIIIDQLVQIINSK